MMMFAGNFVVGWVVSFLGSLPPGVLNLTIVRVSLRQGLRAALEFALACTLIEFLYGYIAVWLTEQIAPYAFFKLLTDGFTLLLLLMLGLYYLRKQSRPPTPADRPATSAFGLGLGLSVVNVAAFPFWLFYTVLLTRKGWVSLAGSPSVLVYVLGIALGTLTGLWFFVGVSQRLNAILATHLHRFDRVMGWLFVGLAIIQGLVLASNQ
ncbi:LysE family transporter [Larkinella sp.]|uniref:LysE family transporter n=1 Tax=Larkinella sp. TaxID=2034517 RepID=UPI003BA997D8